MLDEAQGRGVGIAARLDGQLDVVAGIVAGGVGCEAAGRAVLEALVHGQDHELAGARQATGVHDAGQVGLHARGFRAVPGQDFTHACSGHGFSS